MAQMEALAQRWCRHTHQSSSARPWGNSRGSMMKGMPAMHLHSTCQALRKWQSIHSDGHACSEPAPCLSGSRALAQSLWQWEKPSSCGGSGAVDKAPLPGTGPVLGRGSGLCLHRGRVYMGVIRFLGSGLTKE